MSTGFPDYQAFEIPVLVVSGGTGATSFTSNGVIIGKGSSPLVATAAGAADQVLRVPGAGGQPAFGAIDLAKAAAVTGVLAVANGGSGSATPALVAGQNISITGSWPGQTVGFTGLLPVGNGGWGTADGRYTPADGVHLYGGLSVGHLQDPYIVSATPAYDSGTIPAGTYHYGITAYDAIGESWSGDYTVVLTSIGRIVFTWAPIGGAAGYYIYVGATFATAFRQATVAGGNSYTYNLTSLPSSSGPTAPATNSTGGETRATTVFSATVAGAPAFYFLNEDTVGAASPATFTFIKAPGICAIFQDVNKTELDIQMSAGKAVQLQVPTPTGGTAELDIFVNNVLNCTLLESLNSWVQNTQISTPDTSGTDASPILSLRNIVTGSYHEWKQLNNTSSQWQVDFDASNFFLASIVAGVDTIQFGAAVELKAGGSNQNVTLTPSGTGSVSLVSSGGAPVLISGLRHYVITKTLTSGAATDLLTITQASANLLAASLHARYDAQAGFSTEPRLRVGVFSTGFVADTGHVVTLPGASPYTVPLTVDVAAVESGTLTIVFELVTVTNGAKLRATATDSGGAATRLQLDCEVFMSGLAGESIVVN